MATAYTPGLKIAQDIIIRKTRRLPIKGRVLVKAGDWVEPETVVAQAELPGDVEIIKVTEKLGIEPVEIGKVVKKGVGKEVKKDEIIAESTSFFGLFKSTCAAPISGTIEYISATSGYVGIRANPVPIQVNAYISGRVAGIIPEEGAVIEARGALVQGIFGVGGERQGILKSLVDSPHQVLTPENVKDGLKGKVLVAGALVTKEAIEKAAGAGAVGLVVGGILDKDLIDFLGYDIGIAITGQEDIPMTMILTEGFGEIATAERTFKLLKALEGQLASISGVTQIRAGVIRPEVIVPVKKIGELGEMKELMGKEVELQRLEVGSSVRFIRTPYFGLLGKVTGLPSEPQIIDTGAKVRVLEAKLENGLRVVVPRANVEIIEG